MSAASDSNRQAMWAAASVALVLLGQLVASRAVRDGFFLTHFDATALPSMMTAASIFSVAVVIGSSRLLRRIAPARSLPFFFTGSAALFVVEWALSEPVPRLAAVTLYLHTMSVSAVVASGFWSVVNERFDPHAAKQLIARIGAGASLGGVLGGVAAWQGAALLDVPSMILGLAALNGACALGVTRIGESDHAPAAATRGEDDASSSLWDIFQETPYLTSIAALVILTAFTQALYDYVFKAEAARHYASSAELVSFFALFYLGISVVTFVIQNLLTRTSIERFGLAVSVSSLPGTGAITGALGLLFPGLASGIGMRGGTGVVENSVFRSSYELLYTPVLPEKKRPTKALIDVGGDKLGTAMGGAVAFFVIGIFPELAAPMLVLAGIAASVAGLVLTRRLHLGYVGSLADRLRAGNLDVSEVEVVDATLKIAMSEARPITQPPRAAVAPSSSPQVPGRTELIDRRESGAALHAAPTLPRAPERWPFIAPPPRPLAEEEIDPLLRAIADLRSGERSRIETTLQRHTPLSRELVGHVMPLLAEEPVAQAAASALQRIAPAHTGALLDALMHSRTPLSARRRLCGILGQLPTQRSADGLVAILSNENFELRFRAALALLEIHRRSSRLRIAHEPLFDVALAEARSCRRRWLAALALEGRLSSGVAAESAQGQRVVQGVAFVFTLLLTVLDREPLELAMRALANPSGGDRGTGLEYLENVLPPQLFQTLRPLFLEIRLAPAGIRSLANALTQLVEQSQHGHADLDALRRRVDARRGSPGP